MCEIKWLTQIVFKCITKFIRHKKKKTELQYIEYVPLN